MLLFEGLFTLLFGREEKIIKTKNFTAPKTMLLPFSPLFLPKSNNERETLLFPDFQTNPKSFRTAIASYTRPWMNH